MTVGGTIGEGGLKPVLLLFSPFLLLNMLKCISIPKLLLSSKNFWGRGLFDDVAIQGFGVEIVQHTKYRSFAVKTLLLL